MNTRCKPGELCVIVSAPWFSSHLIGCVRRVLEVSSRSLPDNPMWTYEGSRLRYIDNGEEIDYLDDCLLRPLRDPGEDARDEMLHPLPQEVAA